MKETIINQRIERLKTLLLLNRLNLKSEYALNDLLVNLLLLENSFDIDQHIKNLKRLNDGGYSSIKNVIDAVIYDYECNQNCPLDEIDPVSLNDSIIKLLLLTK